VNNLSTDPDKYSLGAKICNALFVLGIFSFCYLYYDEGAMVVSALIKFFTNLDLSTTFGLVILITISPFLIILGLVGGTILLAFLAAFFTFFDFCLTLLIKSVISFFKKTPPE